MQIVSLEIENVKRLSAVSLTPDPKGKLVVIGGKNAAGKTSLLDSIAMLLGGGNAIPAKPIKAGEDTAKIVGELAESGEPPEFTITRKFKDGGAATLVVQGKDGGAIRSPQALLDSLTSTVSFDPLAFTRMKEGDQADTIRKLTGLDFSALDKEAAEIYVTRTAANREAAKIKAQLDAIPHHPDAGTVVKDAGEIGKRMEAAAQVNADNEKKRGVLDDANDHIGSIELKLKAQNEAIRQLEASLKAAQLTAHNLNQELSTEVEARDKLHKDIAALVDVDLGPIRQELADLTALNQKVAANLARLDVAKRARDKEAEAKKITDRLAAIEGEKEKMLRKTKFPIDGLSFTGQGVAYKGVPFQQASAAEQLRASLAIGAAMQPKLKIALIRDGSLLDDDSLILLGKSAEEYGVQVFIERVGEGAECSIIIEDGAVKEVRASK